ncbi:pep-cterm sorting domain-containing protein [Anaeramoeba ignava]|uniref:Pep-cterm sorting domain-containing protein n=1 Tax=Anaeramoeba ignava TaxID=1746090 RepID=A0A9Q0LMD8_ANAIG|nr:pep-cterm sorting domain-containing protein [Anaeramoeba ignava]
MINYANLEKLSNNLKNLFINENQEENYFDFEIICQQTQKKKPFSFKTHKSILSSRSQYFKSLFNSKMKEYQENKLVLQDFSTSIIALILKYLYSGKIEINLGNAIEILIFSSKYLIEELIEISSKFIKNNLQMETVVDVLELSDSMNLKELFDFSYQFILENFEKLMKTAFFLELEEDRLNSILSNDRISINQFELFQSIIKWGKHKSNINQEKEMGKEEKEQLQNQISDIIHKIRFIDFSKKELENSLKEDLIPNQISQKLIQFQNLQSNYQKNQKELKELIEQENLNLNLNSNLNSFIFKSKIELRTKSSIIQEQEHFEKLKEWIKDNNYFSKMKLGFSAKRDGFGCKKLHSICDNKGKTLVIIKTEDNFIFGGFTEVGFTNDKSKWSGFYRRADFDWIIDSNAFIFSLKNDKNDRKAEMFPIKKSFKKYAVYYDYSNCGPTFGGGYDFYLNHQLKTGYSDFGNSYNLPNGIKQGTKEAKSYLAGSFNKWVVDEIEIYFV